MNKELIAYLKYECEEVEKQVMSIDNEETLYAYMYNYNWDDGFETPSIALKNKHCKLATALMIYYGASGVEMLVEKDMRKGSSK